jgi:general secretion pathway protein E
MIDAALLARARAQSLHSQRPLMAELEAISGLEARQIVRHLAAPFGLSVMETAEMFGQTPAFDLLPLAQAMARHCVLLRGASDELTGVTRSMSTCRPGSRRRPAPPPRVRCNCAWRCSPTFRLT